MPHAGFWLVSLGWLAFYVCGGIFVIPALTGALLGEAPVRHWANPAAWLVASLLSIAITAAQRIPVLLAIRHRQRERDELEAAWEARLRERGMWE